MAKHAEAGVRAKRTLIQGLFVAVLVGAAGAVLAVAGTWSGSEIYSSTAWVTLLGAIVQAVLTAGASWVQRVHEDNKVG